MFEFYRGAWYNNSCEAAILYRVVCSATEGSIPLSKRTHPGGAILWSRQQAGLYYERGGHSIIIAAKQLLYDVHSGFCAAADARMQIYCVQRDVFSEMKEE